MVYDAGHHEDATTATTVRRPPRPANPCLLGTAVFMVYDAGHHDDATTATTVQLLPRLCDEDHGADDHGGLGASAHPFQDSGRPQGTNGHSSGTITRTSTNASSVRGRPTFT